MSDIDFSSRGRRGNAVTALPFRFSCYAEGSVAREGAEVDSDVDLAAEFDPTAEIDLIQMVALERRRAETLGRAVEILPEPVDNLRLLDSLHDITEQGEMA